MDIFLHSNKSTVKKNQVSQKKCNGDNCVFESIVALVLASVAS